MQKAVMIIMLLQNPSVLIQSCPGFFLASGLLLSWCAAVCTWVVFVLLRENVEGRTARECVFGDASLPG